MPYVCPEHQFLLANQINLCAFDQYAAWDDQFRKKLIFHLNLVYWIEYHFLTTSNCFLFQFNIHIHLPWKAAVKRLYAFQVSLQNNQARYPVCSSCILILKWINMPRSAIDIFCLGCHLCYQSSFEDFEFSNYCYRFHFLIFEFFFWNCPTICLTEMHDFLDCSILHNYNDLFLFIMQRVPPGIQFLYEDLNLLYRRKNITI